MWNKWKLGWYEPWLCWNSGQPIEKKSTPVITDTFKCIKVHNGQKTSTVVFYVLRDSIPNDIGTANNLRLRALRSRSCTRWLFPVPMLLGFSAKMKCLTEHSLSSTTTLLHCTESCRLVQRSTRVPQPTVLQRGTASSYLLVSGTALPLARLITFLDVQFVCSDRKLSL